MVHLSPPRGPSFEKVLRTLKESSGANLLTCTPCLGYSSDGGHCLLPWGTGGKRKSETADEFRVRNLQGRREKGREIAQGSDWTWGEEHLVL